MYGREGSAEEIKAKLSQITESVLENLNNERQILSNEEKLTSDSADDTQIYPDFADMVITGQHIKFPFDWCPQDLNFDEDQEILIFPMSPFENLY